MAEGKDSFIFDLRFLSEASKKLHGYFLHTWFHLYLSLISQNQGRWIEQGVLGQNGQPTEETDYLMLFDINAVDIEKIAFLIGLYFYIYASHKKSNYFLMKEDETKRVLYLRGFDYEGAIRAESELAMGYQSVDTTQFTFELADRLRNDFEVFTCLSSRDLWWHTISAQKYFYGDYDGLIHTCSEPIRLFYFNANFWQADIEALFDRMDAFVVYVSSITESALWELHLLKKKQRTEDATVVFDEKAIDNKDIQAGFQEEMRAKFADDVLWSKDLAKIQEFTTEGLRDWLTQSFFVISPDEFFANIERYKKQVAKASGPLGVGSREEPLPFRFFPALDAHALKRIYDFDEFVETVIHQKILSKTITNLPWFLNTVQLNIFTSLMLGRHEETGRALAIYAAIMDVTQKQSSVTHAFADEATDDQKSRVRELLQEHFDMADYTSPRLMACGGSHEFGDYSANALKAYEEIFASTSDAVERFFREGWQRRGLNFV